MAVFFRQGHVFGYTFGVVLLVVLLSGMLFPSYEAHMEIMLRRGRADPVVTAEQNPPMAIARPEIGEEEVNSEVELLKDEDLLRAVVERNRLADEDRRPGYRCGIGGGGRISLRAGKCH
jgi:uncharacterized protein involved in exopolysaccharide biosynthesis